jgi:hypothetical protein
LRFPVLWAVNRTDSGLEPWVRCFFGLWVGKILFTGGLCWPFRYVWLNQMNSRLAIFGVVFVLGLGACSTVGSSPATAPTITEAPVVTSSSVATTTTTTQPATTITLDRVAEIEAIFQDLEVQRLQAIMDQDEEAFRAVFANDEYAERSVGGMDLVTVIDPHAVVFNVVEVFVDEASCVVVAAVQNGTDAIEGAGVEPVTDYVVQPTDGVWGSSWIGSGWRCDGPHPFSE